MSSTIDYMLATPSLTSLVKSCRVDNRTQYWAGPDKIRQNYHSALVMKLHWADMWPGELDPASPGPTLGRSLPTGPNWAALTPDRARAISKRVNMNFHTRWKRIRGIWRKTGRRRLGLATQRNTLLALFKAELLRVSMSVLGKARQTIRPEHHDPSTNCDQLWDKLVQTVGNALGITIDAYGTDARMLLDGPEIKDLRQSLLDSDILLSHDHDEWLRWWHRRDYHRAEALVDREGLLLTDSMATKDPKRFFSQATRPMSSSNIMALRSEEGKLRVTDEAIEEELHTYIQRVADPGPPLPKDVPRQHNKRHKRRTTNRLDMMRNITMDEMTRMLQTLDSTSAAGYDNIAPALLKAVTMTMWHSEVPKSETDRERDTLDDKFITYCNAERRYEGREARPDLLHPQASAAKSTTTVKFEPTQTRSILMRILNLCLQSGDLPSSEKLGIITGLPKSEGLVTSTGDIRPITVGPAVNRLVHKILADRLSSACVKHDLIDKAQFAFVPGGDIHEPISTAAACYRDRLAYQRGCYAIYYDISKAYDTIRWSSIKTAMQGIGLEPAFIDFVMASLEGTRVEMRTNVRGQVTRPVQLHKSIKQGCPLAPLLFVIVMDEMHRDLRASGLGYKLMGGPRVGSRGYCDDTYIVADNIHDLLRMNDEILHPFFTKHGLLINESKTVVTGRNADGTPFTDHICWPTTGKPFETVPPTEAVRYLGCHISLDLNWDTQITKLHALVHTTLAHLQSGRLSLLQAVSLTKFVTGPKMEIAMRHAYIPRDTLRSWDTMLSQAMSKCAGATNGNLHPSGVATTLRLVPWRTHMTSLRSPTP